MFDLARNPKRLSVPDLEVCHTMRNREWFTFRLFGGHGWVKQLVLYQTLRGRVLTRVSKYNKDMILIMYVQRPLLTLLTQIVIITHPVNKTHLVVTTDFLVQTRHLHDLQTVSSSTHPHLNRVPTIGSTPHELHFLPWRM